MNGHYDSKAPSLFAQICGWSDEIQDIDPKLAAYWKERVLGLTEVNRRKAQADQTAQEPGPAKVSEEKKNGSRNGGVKRIRVPRYGTENTVTSPPVTA